MVLAILIGGLLGSAIAGPIGFIAGGALSGTLAYFANRQARRRLGEIQHRFLDGVFAVMGALCKADGRVTEDEIRTAETFFGRFRLNDAQRQRAIEQFNRGKRPDFDLDAELASLRRVIGMQPMLLQTFLQCQVAAVAADGKVSGPEHEMLVRVARGLGLPEGQVAQLEALLRGAASGASAGGQTSEQQLQDAYQALGVSPDDSDATIKKAYRKLMSENHPDKLKARGMSESMREMAEERTAEISHAYDVVKAARKQAA